MQTLELYGEIGEDYGASLEYFNYRFQDLRREYPNDSILVKINSEGGCLKEGLGIANTIELDGNSDTINMGLAGSVAALILLKGRKRFSASSSVTMFHKAFFDDDENNTPENQIILDAYNTEIIKLLVAKTKLGNAESVGNLLDGMGLWLDSSAALKAGVIDQILYSEKSAADAQNRAEKLMAKCQTKILNKIPLLTSEVEMTPEELKTAIENANKPLAEAIQNQATAQKELATQIAELVKNKSDVPDVKALVAEVVNQAVTPVLDKMETAVVASNTASESMKALADKVVSMPSPNNHAAPKVYGVAGNKPIEEQFV